MRRATLPLATFIVDALVTLTAAAIVVSKVGGGGREVMAVDALRALSRRSAAAATIVQRRCATMARGARTDARLEAFELADKQNMDGWRVRGREHARAAAAAATAAAARRWR